MVDIAGSLPDDPIGSATERFVYTHKVGAGPEHPNKKWGLFSTELSLEDASARYSLDAARREDWFGVVLIESEQERPTAYLQMCPRANGVELHKLDQFGSVMVAYTWRAYYAPSNAEPYDGDETRVFLSAITSYVYPEQPRFFMRNASLGHRSMTFGADGYAKDERVTKQGFGEPSNVDLREFRDVDVSANWFPIPEFGDWDRFFHPEPRD